MTETFAPQMARFTRENLKGFGPAEGLPAIQHTTASPSTASLASTTAQLSVLQGHKGVAKLNENGLSTDQLELKVETEQEPSVSDSEDEHDAATRPLNVSERRKAQNSKFSAWCALSEEVMASSVKAHRVKQVIKARSQDHE